MKTLRARMLDAAAGERFEEAAQMRDALTTVQTLQDRQQKMATTELGHRDVFGMKIGPAGAVVQVFQVRRGRVVERIELVTEASLAGAGEPEAPGGGESDVLEAALQQFYEVRTAPPEVHVPVELARPRGARDVALGTGGPQGQARRAATGREAWLDRSGRPQRSAGVPEALQAGGRQAQFDALETLRLVLGLPALPRRIECFDISTIQGSETVASMVVCEDGRMRPLGVPEVQDQGPRAPGSGLRAPGSRHAASRRRESTLEPEVFSGRGWGPDRHE